MTRRTLLRARLFSALVVPARYSFGATDTKASSVEISSVTLALADYVVQAAQKALLAAALEAAHNVKRMTRDEVGKKTYDLCAPALGQDKARSWSLRFEILNKF